MRACGQCDLCCTLIAAPDVDKPEGIKCKYCDNGCTIHAERPETCADYFCEWANENLPEEMRPDKVHFVVEKLPDVPVVIIVSEENHKEDLLEYEEIFKSYTKKGMAVVSTHNKMALLPNEMSVNQAETYIKDAARSMGYL